MKKKKNRKKVKKKKMKKKKKKKERVFEKKVIFLKVISLLTMRQITYKMKIVCATKPIPWRSLLKFSSYDSHPYGNLPHGNHF